MTTMGVPGATGDQALSIEMALRMFDPVEHDGLLRNLAALLGAGGFSDQQMQAALLRVLTDATGIYIPSGLLPRLGLAAQLSQSWHTQTTLAAGTALGANATKA